MADNLEKKAEAAAKPHKKVDARLIGDLAPIVGLILVIVIFAVLTKGALLSKNNLQSLASSVITTAMCAIGAVFVFGAGYFDMSIGGSLCVAAVLGCKAMIATGSFFAGFLVILYRLLRRQRHSHQRSLLHLHDYDFLSLFGLRAGHHGQ